MKSYIVFCFVLTFIKSAATYNGEYLDQLTKAIENEVKMAENYQRRTDNSDIYYESATQEAAHYGEFDFIVVGAGSAGAIVAKRLSEFKFKILLLEAGDVQLNLTDIPGMFKIFQMTDVNWGYKTSPQKHSCQGMINMQCNFPRGKSLGGTSVINGMVYARGNSHDQDYWAEFGITGWSWEETLPYFKKYENYRNIYGDPGYHGWNGPMFFDYSRPNSILIDYFFRGNEEINRSVINDYNGKTQMGVGKAQMQKRNGKRMSINRGYLTEYNKDYLTIETNAYVYKLLINNKTAEGVEFIKNHKNYRATVRKEVIVSTGAINSPQLLMLSGIGPKEELAKHKIPIVVDLPVGKNFEDHIGFVGLRFESNLTLTDRNKLLRSHVWDYLSEVGALTDNLMQGVAFISTEKNMTYPDIELIFIPSGRELFPDLNEYNLNENAYKLYTPSDDKLDYVFKTIIMLLHPKSKGTVTLRSKNPRDFPIIDPNGFSAPEDLEKLYESVVYFKSLMKTKAFQEIDARIMKIVLPACEAYQYDSKDYWLCTIKQMSHQIYHVTGTCAMGKKGSSVVDSKLRVRGVKGLRVVDVSVVPKTNSGHTNALAMMIGEKAADIIRRDNKKSNDK